MIRTEYHAYDDGTYYFLYVTDKVRIETDGVSRLQIEERNGAIRKIEEPFKYLTLEKDEYFNEMLINEHIDTLIRAVKVLHSHLYLT